MWQRWVQRTSLSGVMKNPSTSKLPAWSSCASLCLPYILTSCNKHPHVFVHAEPSPLPPRTPPFKPTKPQPPPLLAPRPDRLAGTRPTSSHEVDDDAHLKDDANLTAAQLKFQKISSQLKAAHQHATGSSKAHTSSRTMNSDDEAACDDAMRILQQPDSNVRPLSLSDLAYALGTMYIRYGMNSTLHKLAHSVGGYVIKTKCRGFDVHQVGVVLQAFARLPAHEFPTEQVFAAAGYHLARMPDISWQVDSARGVAVSSLVWAHATVGYTRNNATLAHGLTVASQSGRLSSADPQCWSNILWAIIKLGIKYADAELLWQEGIRSYAKQLEMYSERIGKNIQDGWRPPAPQGIANVCWAIGKHGAPLTHDNQDVQHLVSCLCVAIDKGILDASKPHDWSNVMYACAKMGATSEFALVVYSKGLQRLHEAAIKALDRQDSQRFAGLQHRINDQDLANGVWAVYTAGYKQGQQLCLDTIDAGFRAGIVSVENQAAVVNMLWCTGRMGLGSTEPMCNWWKELSPQLSERIANGTFTALNASSLMEAAAASRQVRAYLPLVTSVATATIDHRLFNNADLGIYSHVVGSLPVMQAGCSKASSGKQSLEVVAQACVKGVARISKTWRSGHVSERQAYLVKQAVACLQHMRLTVPSEVLEVLVRIDR